MEEHFTGLKPFKDMVYPGTTNTETISPTCEFKSHANLYTSIITFNFAPPGDQREAKHQGSPAWLHRFLLLPFPFLPPFILLLFPSPSPTPGPTVIGIPSGSWDPYKHSRQRVREEKRQCLCEWEKDMDAERKRKPASQYAGSLEHWVTVAAASFVCVCPILFLKQSPPPLSAHTGTWQQHTPGSLVASDISTYLLMKWLQNQ